VNFDLLLSILGWIGLVILLALFVATIVYHPKDGDY